ncbi:UNVERIFIED_CONTAM: hypothetical protein Slati_3136300 [Sesamum latifolium]|uniref:Uncharacterized protein n=1 Tax=Sesamum latifolium TaxID=2727402 RepID=A0AAW2UV63_9LAMI
MPPKEWSNAVELSEHGIEFQLRPAIKVQVLEDFTSDVAGRRITYDMKYGKCSWKDHLLQQGVEFG